MYTRIQRHRHTHTGIYTHSPTDGHRHTGVTNSDSSRQAVNTKAICLPSDGKHAGVIKISEHRETGQATHPKGEGPEAGHISHAWIQAWALRTAEVRQGTPGMDGGRPWGQSGKQTKWVWLRDGAAGQVRVAQEEEMASPGSVLVGPQPGLLTPSLS